MFEQLKPLLLDKKIVGGDLTALFQQEFNKFQRKNRL
jgi:hypothetical protein